MLTASRHSQTADSEAAGAFERAHQAWSTALASPNLRAVGRALELLEVDVDECLRETASITELPSTWRRLEAIRNMVHAKHDVAPGALERFVLGHAALRWEDALRCAPVPTTVKCLTFTGLARLADDRSVLDVSTTRFVALCKLATQRRFAAGQFDWERSGLPRSWLPRVRPVSALIRLLTMAAAEWRAFAPAFFVHMPVTRPLHALFEREGLRAYFRMAQAMALQPEIKALIASAWLHSPATFEVSPHLAWLNKTFAEHGAVIATMGAASPDCGVLEKSVERQRAFSEGRFKPTLGLIVWNRRDMLTWAAGHPELGSS